MSDYNFEKVQPKTMAFNEIGDFITGTLVEIDRLEKPDKWGKRPYIYTIKSKDGMSHPKDKETKQLVKTEIGEGETWTIFANDNLHRKMQGIQIGQIIQIKFTEERETDKGNDAKIREVYQAKDAEGKVVLDQEWLDSQAGDNFEGDED